MVKLFALEDELKDDSNDLLIDKIIEKSKQPKSSMSLTADILQQRQELKKDIVEKLNTEPEDSSETVNKEESDSSTESEPKEEDSSSTDEKTSTSSEDIPEDGDDEESLKSLIGSGLNDKEESQATESFSTRVTLANIFKPMKLKDEQYKVSLETYNLRNKAISIEEQPLVYVKESVVESLNNLILLSKNYVDSNTSFIENMHSSIRDINERITVFKTFIDKNLYSFTNKLINDKDILSVLSCPEKSDLRETIRLILNFAEDTNKATSLLVNNSFSDISSSYLTNNYIKEDTEIVYKTIVPGFNLIKIHLDSYDNYLNTKIQEFQFYRLKVLKTEDLFNLNSITISDDKELNFINTQLDNLLVNIATNIDSINDVNNNFSKFIDELKVIIFDISEDKYKDLSSISIDDKVKDFIKFKLIIESNYISTSILMEYITTLMSVLNECVSLKE